jgi:alpha-L-rhamnosidase
VEASSAAHIHGRTDVYAEAYTSQRTFQQSPASMKAWTDWAFSIGINHFILHVYIHHLDERRPGILQWFGTDFNRHTTWFEQGKAFIDFLRRDSVLLKSAW